MTPAEAQELRASRALRVALGRPLRTGELLAEIAAERAWADALEREWPK